ncbi:AAA family ATPase [Methanobrevibacter sp.]|uniref:AAA family ATPase n=1 Tax=Methanobrevibacter sp. TaxID=66852 RepID=UPI0034CDA4E0
MQVIGITGMPGSGKSIVSDLACKKGAIIVSMGDIIREEAEKRGETTGETAVNLRKEFGEYIVSELTIEKIKKLQKEGHDKIVVEGIRSHHEVEMFKESFDNFIIVSIFAKPMIRFERLKKRKREDDSQDYAGFSERDQRELGFGMGNVISLSDRTLINESDLDSFIEKVEKFLDEIGF